MVDDCDVFLEEVGADGRSVRQGDRSVACEVREETIRVKGGPDVVEQVLVTPRGPIVGAAVGGDVGAMSLAATWLEPRPVKGLVSVHRARSLEEFRAACAEWPLSSLNMVYADTTGTVGWQLMGDAPRRRKGWGMVPRPGWDPDAGWEDGPVPFDRMPHAAGPPGGILATANNSPTADEAGPFLGADWLDGYRVARIVERLESRSDWDVASTLALHLDEYCLAWRELRDSLLATPASTDETRLAIELLAGWDGHLSPDSNASTVFQFFLAEMCRMVAKAKAPRSWAWALGRGPNVLSPYTLLVARRTGHLVRLVRDQPDGWFDAGWSQAIEGALAKAVTALKRGYGDDSGRWAWGRVRPLTLRHLLGDRRILGRIFNLGPFPWGGDANTVSQAATLPDDPAINPLAIASMRMAVDVGSWEESRFVLPGGQSGNPLSPHYDDMLPLWKRGEGVPIAWSPEEVRKATRTTLKLSPPDAP
jgi:penicillin amidase